MARTLIVDDHYIPTPAEIAEHQSIAAQVRQEWKENARERLSNIELDGHELTFKGAVPRRCPDCGRAWVGCRCEGLA